MKKLLLVAAILFASLFTHQVVAQVNTLDIAGLSADAPAVAAYSLNKLSSTYSGVAIQVRRSNDDAVQDIGFTPGGYLDTTALKAFVGSNNGYVTIWYDQSGNTRNLTQTNSSRQPSIVNAGTIYRRNGLPTLYHDDDGLAYSGADYLNTTPLTVNTVAGSNSNNGGARRAIQGTSNWLIGPYGNNDGWYTDGWNYYYSAPWSVTRVENFTVVEPQSDPDMAWRDGALQPMIGNAKGVPNKLSTGTEGVYFEPLDGYISEILAFNSVLSNTDRLAMEQHQKAVYAIVSSNAMLSALSISDGALNPGFSATTNNYIDIVDNAVSTITVTPTPASVDAVVQVQVNGSGYYPVTNGTASAALTLAVGANAIDVKIKAQDSVAVNNYTITVYRAPLPPTTQATNVTFTATAALATTVNWINGDGAARAVFMSASLTGSPLPDPGVTYTANPIFGSGTQIGSSGWYCIYNGTGTTANVVGLTGNTTYRLMTVEFNGSGGTERYLTTPAAGNPANVTTIGLNTLDKLGLNSNVNSTAATYALRLLSTTYTGPLARINAGGNYYDVYPDASADRNFSVNSPISAAYANYNDAGSGATGNTLSSIISGSTIATVAIWFDQSGNGTDAIQASAGNQPAIINGGIIYTENGKPALRFTASSGSYLQSNNNVTIADGSTANTVAQNISTPNNTAAILTQVFQGNTIGFFLGHFGTTFSYAMYVPGWQQSNFDVNDFPTSPFIATGVYSNNAIDLYVNRVQQNASGASNRVSSTNPLLIGRKYDSGEYFDGYIPEVTLFTAGLAASDLQAMEGSQYTYFGLGLPYVVTKPVLSITVEGVTLPGKVISDFANPVTSKGIVYGLTANPTITADSVVTNGTGTGDILTNITALTPLTVYHFRAFATNSVGTAYGEDQTFTTLSAPNILDKLGLTSSTLATGDYSLRLLSSTYTGPLARININNAYYDVYPDATTDKSFSLTSPISAVYTNYNDVQTGATANLLSSIVSGATNATVVTWYDQTGNANDAVQTNQSQQPEIINAGTIDNENGRPALRFSSPASTYFQTVKNVTIAGAVTTNAVAQNINTYNSYASLLSQIYTGGAIGFFLGHFGTTMGFAIYAPGFQQSNYNGDFPTTPFVATGTYGGTAVNLYVNQVASPPASANAGVTITNPFRIGARWDNQEAFDGYIPEAILFASELSSAKRTAVENNQISYYNLTVPGSISTSGTLAALTTSIGTASASDTLIVSGARLVNPITVTPPAGFEVSKDNITFASTVNVGAAGNLADSAVYIRLAAATAIGSYSGNVVLSSIGSQSVNVAIPVSKVIAVPNYLDKAGLAATTPATGAYSMRLLSSTYTGPLARITVGSSYYDVYPDTTANKAFSLTSPISTAYSNYNDTKTGVTTNLLSSIIGNNQATVAIWYDQGGIGNDVLQATTSNQPAIINGGIVYTQNGRPALRFLGQSANYFRSANNVTIEGASTSNAVAQNINSQGSYPAIISQIYTGGAIGFFLGRFNGTLAYAIHIPGWQLANYTSDFPTSPFNATGVYDGANVNLYVNGTASTPGSATVNQSVDNPIVIGTRWDGGGDFFDGYLPEVTLFSTALSTPHRQSMESNQYTYYGLGDAIVTTGAPIAVTVSTATLTGNATSDAGHAITSKGIVYNQTGNPTITADNVLTAGSDVGAISVNAINLTAGTTYHYRAFATNSEGTGYGADQTFSTSAILDKVGLTASDPAAGGYSLRLLSSTYTGPLVRITVGSNYYDVYPDTTSAKTFSLNSPVSAAYTAYNATLTGATTNLLSSVIGSSSATVVTWYDQSASGNHAVQASPGNQPEIISGGVVDKVNGLPTLIYSGAQFLVIPQTFGRVDHPNAVVNAVYQNTVQSGNQALWGSDNGNWDRFQLLYWGGSGISFGLSNGGGTNSTPATNTGNQLVYSAVMNYGTPDGTFVSVNGVNSTPYTESQGDGTGNITIGAIGSGGNSLIGNLSEFTLFFNAIPTADRQALELNQQIYYAVPSIIVSNTANVTALSAGYGTPSATVRFNVAAISVAQGILITAPTGFEVSTDSITFRPAITIGAAGNIASTPVYVRLAATTGIGSYSGDITLVSGSISQSVTIPASSVSAQPITLNKLGLTNTTAGAGAYSLRLLASNYAGPLARIAIGSNYYDVYPDTTANKTFSLSSPISAAYSNYNDAATGVTANLLSGIIATQSATVAVWYDQSGNATNGIQGNTAMQPEIIHAGVVDVDSHDNLPAIKFGGSNNLIVTATIFNNDLSGSVVYNATPANQSADVPGAWYTMNGIFGSEQPGGTTDFGFGVYNGKFTAGNGPADNSVATAIGVTNGLIRQNSWTRTDSTGYIDLYTNSLADGSAILNSGARTAVPSIAIGSSQTFSGGGVFFNGTISEMALFPKVYGPTERAAIEGSQMTYYGIPNNTAPTDIALSATLINENVAAASTIGTFTATDAEGGAMSYQLITGTGDTDNSAFTIVNDSLKINASPDYETKSSYTVRVKVTDSGLLTFEKQFTITINNLAEVVVDQASLAAATVGSSYSQTITGSGGTSPYTFAVTSGALPAGLSISADSGNAIISGSPTGSGTFNFTITATDSSSFTGSKALSIAVNAGTPAITYASTASVTYGAADFDPAATSTNGNAAIIYSSSDSTIASIVNNKVHIIKPGTVTIYADQAADSNYMVAAQKAQLLTIDKKALTLTLNASPTIARVYNGLTGATLAAANYALAGINGADSVTVTGTATYDTKDAAGGKAVTATSFVLAGADKDKYTLSTTSATTTGDITRAPLTIKVDSLNKAYGAAVPTLTVSYSGFVNGETVDSLTTQPVLSTTATVASHVAGSPYTISASSAVSANYSITYVSGTLSVNAVPLTITADNQVKIYGAALPALTANYIGFVNSDTPANLTTAPTLTTTATSSSPVNTYAITAGGAMDSDYTISYAPGTLTIGKAQLTITADNQSKAYGDAVPTLTASYAGFVNGETSASLTTAPTLAT
ncbi:MBG domain-containing protein, partial [Mucilaginibacter sp. UR6-11]|uniref:MBG domain-containing protein n=1 Tax=Mucilaginibacter sp. UR6-11 TaxID=1435644 RepID=UPI001E3AA02C